MMTTEQTQKKDKHIGLVHELNEKFVLTCWHISVYGPSLQPVHQTATRTVPASLCPRMETFPFFGLTLMVSV